jgi:hypothetical protein
MFLAPPLMGNCRQGHLGATRWKAAAIRAIAERPAGIVPI